MTAHRPWPTIMLMAMGFLWIPLASWMIEASGSNETLGLSTVLPVLLGVVGAVVAALDRQLAPAARVGWAVTSVLVGLAALPFWWSVVLMIAGP